MGDRARFRLPDKSVHRGVVTANDDGTYSLEEGTGVVHRLPGARSSGMTPARNNTNRRPIDNPGQKNWARRCFFGRRRLTITKLERDESSRMFCSGHVPHGQVFS